MTSYWEQYPEVKGLVVSLLSKAVDPACLASRASYGLIRYVMKSDFPAVPLPSNSQIYRLRKEFGYVDAGRGRCGANGIKNVWEKHPKAREIALEMRALDATYEEIRDEIRRELGIAVTNSQLRGLLGQPRTPKTASKIPLNPPLPKGEEEREDGQNPAATADDADCADEIQQNPPVSPGRAQGPAPTGGKTPEPAADDNNRSLLERGAGGPFSSEKEPTTVSSPPSGPLYTRPCTTPLVTRPAPRGFPSGLRDKFAADLVEIPELSAKALAMLSHDQAEGCNLPGVIRQSLISCLKRQVTAGHARYIKPLGGGGLALNLFYLRCSQCPNFLSDQDCDAVIEGLREIWRRRASERNRRVA